MLEFLTLHPPAFGLDISDRSLKIAQFEKKKSGFRLSSFAQADLPKGVIEEGEIKLQDELAKAVAQTLGQTKGKKIRTKYVVAALPEEKAFVQVVKLPRMKKEDVIGAVRFQAENFIPYPLETVYLDFSIIEPFHDHLDHRDVLVVSMPRGIVDSYVSVLEKAGLSPAILEIEATALVRAVVAHGASPVPLLIADIGKTRTKVTIFSGYSVRFTTSLPISSEQFTEAVAKRLGVDERRAEELKLQYGLHGADDPAGKEVFEAMVPAATDFCEQVNKYMEYYETHVPHQHLGKPQKQIRKVLLCGGGASLKGLAEFVMRELKVAAQVGSPWVNILPGSSNEVPPIPFAESLAWSTALGLALRGADPNHLYD